MVLVENMLACGNLTESDPDTVLYPINLASLKAFYDEVNETSANDLFLVPPQLPPFNLTFFGEEMSHLSAKDDKLVYDLTKLSDHLQNSTVVLGTPLEAMMYNFLNTQSSFWSFNTGSWTTWLILAILALSILNFALFWNLRRQLMLATFASMLGRNPVLAYSLKLPTTTETFSPSSEFLEQMRDIISALRHLDSALILITLALTITLICLVIKLERISRRTSKIYLQICLPESTLEINLKTLPTSTRDFDFHVPTTVMVTMAYLGPFGVLYVNTTDWLVSNILTHERVRIPTWIILGPRMANRLRGENLTNVRPIIIHNYEYELLGDPEVPAFV